MQYTKNEALDARKVERDICKQWLVKWTLKFRINSTVFNGLDRNDALRKQYAGSRREEYPNLEVYFGGRWQEYWLPLMQLCHEDTTLHLCSRGLDRDRALQKQFAENILKDKGHRYKIKLYRKEWSTLVKQEEFLKLEILLDRDSRSRSSDIYSP
ncbi:uncharacterized protein [Palaemon carinicauda]|uniref:uncharacterized protein n=1 Tax=Palaemon carinicauda TaxID=392227 RepID=UPI0035B5C0C1